MPLPQALAAVTLATLASAPAPAHADSTDTTWSLAWVRAPGAEVCPAAPAIAAAVEAQTGRDTFVSSRRATMHVEGLVDHDAGGWRARLRTVDARGTTQGERELHSAGSCTELAEEVAIVIALLVDPLRGARPPAAATPEPAAPDRAPERTRTVLRTVVIEQTGAPAASRPSYRMETGFAWLAGLLPAVSPGLIVRAAVLPRGFAGIAVDAGFWPEAQSPASNGRAAHFTATYGGISLCPLWLEGDRLATSACAGLQAGTLIARGTGFDVDSSGARWLVQAGVALDGSLRVLGPAALWTGAGVGVPFVRDRFFARDADGRLEELHQASPLTGWLGVGLRASLPKRF